MKPNYLESLEQESVEQLNCLKGLVDFFDSVTQKQEQELKDFWLPRARAILSRFTDESTPTIVKTIKESNKRLVFNKLTRKIDIVRTHDGLVTDSFDPPE